MDSSDSQPSFELRGEGGKSEGACGDAGDDGEIRYVGDDSCEGEPAGVDFFVGVNDDVFVILLSAGMDAVRCK